MNWSDDGYPAGGSEEEKTSWLSFEGNAGNELRSLLVSNGGA